MCVLGMLAVRHRGQGAPDCCSLLFSRRGGDLCAGTFARTSDEQDGRGISGARRSAWAARRTAAAAYSPATSRTAAATTGGLPYSFAFWRGRAQRTYRRPTWCIFACLSSFIHFAAIVPYCALKVRTRFFTMSV